jgi:hypothetical protein
MAIISSKGKMIFSAGRIPDLVAKMPLQHAEFILPANNGFYHSRGYSTGPGYGFTSCQNDF